MSIKVKTSSSALSKIYDWVYFGILVFCIKEVLIHVHLLHICNVLTLHVKNETELDQTIFFPPHLLNLTVVFATNSELLIHPEILLINKLFFLGVAVRITVIRDLHTH